MRAALVVALVLFASSLPALSQPESQRASEGRPDPRLNAASKAKDGAEPAPKAPLVVRVIKTDDDPVGTARKEAEAEQRNKDDLIAQQSAASAAWTQAGIGREQVDASKAANDYALWAVIANGIGAALLLITVGLTWKSTSAATKAANAATRAVELEERAFAPLLVVEGIDLVYDSLDAPEEPQILNPIKLTVRNFGKGPTAIKKVRAYYATGLEPTVIDQSRINSANAHRIVPPLDTMTVDHAPSKMTIDQYRAWDSRSGRLFVVGELIYAGSDGSDCLATFCWQYPLRGDAESYELFTFRANPDNPLNQISPRPGRSNATK